MVYIKKVKPNGNITNDMKAYSKAYYQTHKAHMLATAADRYQANKVEIAELRKVQNAAYYLTAKAKRAKANLIVCDDIDDIEYIEETGEYIVWKGNRK